MEDNSMNKRKTMFEPGSLDKTRKNLGSMDPKEALRMMEILGGEIGIEKAEPVDEESVRNVASNYRATNRGSSKKRKVHSTTPRNSSNSTTSLSSVKTNTPVVALPIKKEYRLPKWNSKDKTKLDKIMYSHEFGIKPSPNIFTRIFGFAIGQSEKISATFIRRQLKKNIVHIQKFAQSIHAMVEMSPEILKSRIHEAENWQDKALKFIYEWDTKALKIQLLKVEQIAQSAELINLVDFIREIYTPLIKLYFLGEENMTKLIKSLYTEITCTNPNAKTKLMSYAKIAATEWLYIYGQVIRGLYPLLMRMSSSTLVEVPEYFTSNISDILTFLKLTKYDLIIPRNDDSVKKAKETKQQQLQREAEEKKEKERNLARKKVLKSVVVLERLFPEAGWSNLESMPDMYPYFQPLYKFKDGFNYIDPKNPLQITIILLRILEDFFQGFRNIDFTTEGDLAFVIEKDSLQDILAQWSLYREVIFDKQLRTELKEFVHTLHTQPDYPKTQFGKRKFSNWLWQEKYYFLKHLSFELVFMEKPDRDGTYNPLSTRVEYLKKALSIIIQRTEYAAQAREDITESTENLGASNLEKPYHFEVDNIVSRRLDILLGGKKSKNRTNINLLKYTVCVINVLDWWINAQDSPAYQEEITSIYRTTEDHKTPVFSIPVLSNQNELFIKHVKEFDEKK